MIGFIRKQRTLQDAQIKHIKLSTDYIVSLKKNSDLRKNVINYNDHTMKNEMNKT